MDALDKLFIVCAAITIVVAAVFGYLVLKVQGWPLAILTSIILLPLLMISGLTTSETLARPFGRKSQSGDVKIHPAISIIMAFIFYAVVAVFLYIVFDFARLI